MSNRCNVCDCALNSTDQVTVDGSAFCGPECLAMFGTADVSDGSDSESGDNTEIGDDSDETFMEEDSSDDDVDLSTEYDGHLLGRRVQYKMKDKRRVLKLLETVSMAEVSRKTGVKYSTVRNWRDNRDAILTFQGSEQRRSMRTGRTTKVPCPEELVRYMRDLRRDERALSTIHLINHLKVHKRVWLDEYLGEKKNPVTAYKSLCRLLQRFAAANGFSRRAVNRSKEKTEDIIAAQDKFSAEFWERYSEHPLEDIINIDETGVYYDMPPSRIWALRGGSSKVANAPKQSSRVTAVMGVRANGEKLPIMFIFKGEPGGRIETDELSTYPAGHYYAVQSNTWMDGTVWAQYLKKVFKREVRGPSVLLVDNFDSHVTEESHEIVSGKLFSILEPVPKNTTSVAQPLDVGVMGALKSKLRVAWLEEEADFMKLSARQKRCAIVERTIRVWESIEESTVKGSFEKALPVAMV